MNASSVRPLPASRCARCGVHLGHVFPDGRPLTREYYCLNSVRMEFVDAGQPLPRKTETDRANP
jgi:peptide methionine sulfoxide reductase MsrB